MNTDDSRAPVASTSLTTLVAFVVVTLGAGALGGLAAAPGVWYASLDKPTWNPPPWVFGPVWITLYVLIGVAAGARLARQGHPGGPSRVSPLCAPARAQHPLVLALLPLAPPGPGPGRPPGPLGRHPRHAHRLSADSAARRHPPDPLSGLGHLRGRPERRDRAEESRRGLRPRPPARPTGWPRPTARPGTDQRPPSTSPTGRARICSRSPPPSSTLRCTTRRSGSWGGQSRSAGRKPVPASPSGVRPSLPVLRPRRERSNSMRSSPGRTWRGRTCSSFLADGSRPRFASVGTPRQALCG